MDLELKIEVKSCLISYLSDLQQELKRLKQSNSDKVLLSWVQEDINKVEKVLKQL